MRLENKLLLRIFLAAALPGLLCAKTNILFMIADDLGWNDVGYHGSEIATPNIDALVRKGVEIDRYYAFPVCSPTRAALMTGRSPIRMGIDSPIGPNGGLPLDEHLLPETLRAAGYQTLMTGKWHLGLERAASHPHNRGFDRSHGHLGPAVDYFTHIWNGGLDWQRNGEALREEGYSTELIVREAVSLIVGRDKSKPMFLYVAFNAPHTPLQATEKYLDRYAGIADVNRKHFAAMVSAVDDGVGAILDTLRAEGLDKDTIVVWVSDNGGNERAGADNSPFRGGKGNVFEGGIRVPGTIYRHGVLEGRKFTRQITAHDWFPTLAAAVGVKPQNAKKFDGLDMWAVLADGAEPARGDTIIGVDGHYAIFRDGWKFVEYTPRNGTETTTHLFRIEDDPNEEHDFIDEKPDLAQQLLAAIRAVPRPPSVSRDVVPAGRPGGARGNKAAKKKGRRGPGARNPREGWPEETRAPWVETAIRD